MKTAIVTGANGFIGRALLKELVEYDVDVCAVVKNDSSLHELAKVFPNSRFCKEAA